MSDLTPGQSYCARLIERAEAAERRVTVLEDALKELSACVLRGWTDPALARGRLHNRAVEIARAYAGKEQG